MGSVEAEAVAAARRVAESCAVTLQASLVSAILHGSLTMDDFKPGASDLDLLLVVERALTTHEAEALIEVVRAADLGPAGGVDLLVVTRRTAEAPAAHPALELLVGRWPDSPGKVEVEGPDNHVDDLWPELSEARANGRSLVGPEPRDVLGEVPADRVRDNGAGWLRTWLGRVDDDESAVHMMLTACRIWRFASTGQHTSKTAAARWALQRDPSLVAVDLALSARSASAAPRIEPSEVERVLLRVIRGVQEDARG